MAKEPPYSYTRTDIKHWAEKYHLEPCPFCGEHVGIKASKDDECEIPMYDVMCGTPGCYLEQGADWYLTIDEVIQMWNKRAGEG